MLAATEGTFRCSRPRSFGGRVIEELSGEFRGGRLVRLEAKRESDRDWLARYLAAIPNADRLGEIALVDNASRIGRTGLIYYNGLLDENAAAHIAFGSGFAKTRTRPARPPPLRRQPLEDAHRRDDRHGRARSRRASAGRASGSRSCATVSGRSERALVGRLKGLCEERRFAL